MVLTSLMMAMIFVLIMVGMALVPVDETFLQRYDNSLSKNAK